MTHFKIATWNVNSLRVRLPQILAWLKEHQPDVLALQETKILDEDFPLDAIHEAGYTATFSGQKSYNGVAILSRVQQENVITEMPLFNDPQKRVLGATIGDIRVLNLYVPNGESTESPKYQYKLEWLRYLQQWVTEELKKAPHLIILGDFNIAPAAEDVYDPLFFAGRLLCSDPEREALQGILQLGLQDSFRLHTQPEKSYSWWDYRLNSFKRNLGLRIDHIFSSLSLSERCSRCFIDKMPRGAERPSDHAPVLAEFSTGSV